MIGSCITMSNEQVKKLCEEKRAKIDSRRSARLKLYAIRERETPWRSLLRFLGLPEPTEDQLVERFKRSHREEVDVDNFEDDHESMWVQKICALADRSEQVLVGSDDLSFLVSE